jgi:hypothetical protein
MSTTIIATISRTDASPARVVRNGLASRFDRLGIAASMACAIHCIVAPLLLLLLPAVGSIWSHPSVHWILAALVLPLALIVVSRGYRHHRHRSAVIAAILGAALIVAGLLIPAANTEPSAAMSALADTPQSHQPMQLTHAAAESCTNTCCPSIAVDPQSGSMSLNVPSASLVTIIGSVLLVLAHGINLYGCRCLSRAGDPRTTTCGCPDACEES